jgi:hypothetical protein
MLVLGTRLFGAVDQVPGVFHIATKFLHLNFIPLIPTGSALILDKKLTEGELVGVEIGLCFKSVLAAWVRAALVFGTIVTGFLTFVYLLEAFAAGPGVQRDVDENHALIAAAVFPLLLAAWWLSYRVTRASYAAARYWLERVELWEQFGPLVERRFHATAAPPADELAAQPVRLDFPGGAEDVFRLE